MKYFKYFNTHNEYLNFKNTNDGSQPILSFCQNEILDHFDKRTYNNKYLTFIILADGIIHFDYNQYITTSQATYLEYSFDNGLTWTRITNLDNELVSETINVSKGDKIIWRGINKSFSLYNSSYFSHFYSEDTSVKIYGNIMSLLYGDEFIDKTTLTSDNNSCFACLFGTNIEDLRFFNCVNAKNLILPATTLTQYCYLCMFTSCRSLTDAPELPATTLSDYCYDSMFTNTSITKAPELPATTLADGCYQSMFQSCSQLIKAPSLPATTLVDDCYLNMFNNCINLKHVSAMFKTIPSPNWSTTNWLNAVSSEGIFVKSKNATWELTGPDGIPSGWKVYTVDDENI